MPWAFSPKHYLFLENQKFVRLWKTHSTMWCRVLSFTDNDRRPVLALELSGILIAHKDARVPLEIVLPGGHCRTVLVRAVGMGWFSANDAGASDTELVIACDAVVLASGSLEEVESVVPGCGQIPLRAMLAHLERQHTTLIMHLEELVLVGVINGVGADCVAFLQTVGRQVAVPFARLLWLEVCG